MPKREKIIQKITITYEPKRDDYGIYDIKPDATYEMAALDKSLLRSGELTIGDWDEDEVYSEWLVVEVGEDE